MDDLYSKFYTGNTSPFGIGTWDSNKPRKLYHSSSQPFYQTKSSIRSNNLVLPPVGSKYDNGGKKYNQYTTQSSSSISSFRYDTKQNRNELSNYIKDINYNVATRLQNDNFLAQQKLNNLKNNYNEIKTLLNNKLEKLEQDQQMQFDNLKYALGQGGGLKMLGAVKNANGGNDYDLNLAEQEDIIDATRRLPSLIDKKINEAFGYKKYSNLRNGGSQIISNMSDMRRNIDEELKRQRTLDEMKFRRELDEIEAKRENIRQERQKMLQELQSQDLDDLEDPLYIPPLPPPPMFNPYNPYNPYMPPPYFMPPMNNNNNNRGDSSSELIKIFLIKKLFDDNKQQPYPYPYQYYPGMPMPPYTYQPQSSNQTKKNQNNNGYPMQPIILQNPFPFPNAQDQQSKDKRSSESQKGIPFVDPLEKYLEMVNKAKGTGSYKKTKKKNGEDGEEENEEGEGEGEEGEGEGEEGNEEGEGEGEEGNEEGEGEGEGEEGNEEGEGDEEG